MPAQKRAPRPTRDQYVHWEQVTTRWADIDVYGHMNNARYFEIIDTVVNNHLEQATGTDIRTLPAIGVVAEVGCTYFAEVGYPAPVDVGVYVARLGNSSVIYKVGLFQGDDDEARAEGTFVHVYVDNTDPARPVVPIPPELRSAVEPLVRASRLTVLARPAAHPARKRRRRRQRLAEHDHVLQLGTGSVGPRPELDPLDLQPGVGDHRLHPVDVVGDREQRVQLVGVQHRVVALVDHRVVARLDVVAPGLVPEEPRGDDPTTWPQDAVQLVQVGGDVVRLEMGEDREQAGQVEGARPHRRTGSPRRCSSPPGL